MKCILPTFHLQIENLESVISDKKKMLEKLVSDMKEANLQSLSISPAEEIKLLLEGEWNRY